MTLFKSDFFLIILIYLILLIPVFFIGNPGFYGDDFSFIEYYKEGNFFRNHYSDLISGAGYSHRPIGWFLLLTFYLVFKSNALFAYIGSITLFVILLYFVQRLLIKLDRNTFFVTSILIIFAFIPFSATVFYQIPSSYMVITYIFLFVFLYYFIFQNDFTNIYKNIFFSLFWLFILLCYESSIGIAFAMPFMLLLKNYLYKKNFKIIEYLKLFLIIGVPTIIFIFLYFTDSSNIKVIALENSYLESDEVNQNGLTVKNLETTAIFKINNFIDKSMSFIMFCFQSIIYLINNINKIWFPLLLVYSLSSLIIFNLLKSKYFKLSLKINLLLMLLGISWALGSITPFLLYPGFTVPVYHLMLPSFGIGIFSFGFFGFLLGEYFFYIYKYLISLIMIIFISIQLSYLVALNEELTYWENLAQKTRTIIGNLDKNQEFQLFNLPEKNNFHVFWMEEAIGKKHFRMNMGFMYDIDTYDYSIYTDTKNKKMNIKSLSKNNQKEVITLNFNEL